MGITRTFPGTNLAPNAELVLEAFVRLNRGRRGWVVL